MCSMTEDKHWHLARQPEGENEPIPYRVKYRDLNEATIEAANTNRAARGFFDGRPFYTIECHGEHCS